MALMRKRLHVWNWMFGMRSHSMKERYQHILIVDGVLDAKFHLGFFFPFHRLFG